MAMHRRPLVDGLPLELVVFRPDDWLPAVGDVSPYEAWLKARFEWARDYPDDFEPPWKCWRVLIQHRRIQHMSAPRKYDQEFRERAGPDVSRAAGRTG